MSWTNTLEVSDVVTKLLDGLDLLVEVVTLNEVRHLQVDKNIVVTEEQSNYTKITEQI